VFLRWKEERRDEATTPGPWFGTAVETAGSRRKRRN
jgi:hypothetical protein